MPEFIAKRGGEYLVRGGEFEIIEGDWEPNRLMLFKFPNRQAIRNYFADSEYAKIAAVRFRTSKTIAVPRAPYFHKVCISRTLSRC